MTITLYDYICKIANKSIKPNEIRTFTTAYCNYFETIIELINYTIIFVLLNYGITKASIYHLRKQIKNKNT